MLRLALPDSPAADVFAQAVAAAPERLRPEVTRLPWHETADAVRRGDADLALVPTFTVLRTPDDFTVLPAVALSAWDYPFARLFLKGDLSAPVETLAADPRDTQAVVLASLLLREHYGMAPSIRPLDAPSLADLDEADAVLLTGPDVPFLDGPGLAMDLGQEWYELANYPMVWGLFAARSGAATPAMLRLVKGLAASVEAGRAAWVAAQERSETLRSFYADSLRVRFDDLATASLTELADLLFESGRLDEVPTLPLAAFKDEDAEDTTKTPEA